MASPRWIGGGGYDGGVMIVDSSGDNNEVLVVGARSGGGGDMDAVATTAVGLLLRPSVSSNSRGRRLVSLLKWRLGFVGGSLPFL